MYQCVCSFLWLIFPGMDIPQFTHSLDACVGGFYLLTTMSNAVINTRV